ncbi:ParB N-terminal domain-containing protein, partial [Sphingorhabdus sp.]|uniref:ParB N-terminal domain-containing protein n=1 Tax=Sphingorhabdus sp. TaxID=1902408 RepID=UPI0037847347
MIAQQSIMHCVAHSAQLVNGSMNAMRSMHLTSRTNMQQNWPAQSSELWPIKKITPYARNARTHSDDQVAQIAASIREWGWTNPLLVDE